MPKAANFARSLLEMLIFADLLFSSFQIEFNAFQIIGIAMSMSWTFKCIYISFKFLKKSRERNKNKISNKQKKKKKRILNFQKKIYFVQIFFCSSFIFWQN